LLKSIRVGLAIAVRFPPLLRRRFLEPLDVSSEIVRRLLQLETLRILFVFAMTLEIV
jgi:hypothetical protein